MGCSEESECGDDGCREVVCDHVGGNFVQAQTDPVDLQRDIRQAWYKIECGRRTVADGIGKTEPDVELLIMIQDIREIRDESIVVSRCRG